MRDLVNYHYPSTAPRVLEQIEHEHAVHRMEQLGKGPDAAPFNSYLALKRSAMAHLQMSSESTRLTHESLPAHITKFVRDGDSSRSYDGGRPRRHINTVQGKPQGTSRISHQHMMAPLMATQATNSAHAQQQRLPSGPAHFSNSTVQGSAQSPGCFRCGMADHRAGACPRYSYSETPCEKCRRAGIFLLHNTANCHQTNGPRGHGDRGGPRFPDPRRNIPPLLGNQNARPPRIQVNTVNRPQGRGHPNPNMQPIRGDRRQIPSNGTA